MKRNTIKIMSIMMTVILCIMSMTVIIGAEDSLSAPELTVKAVTNVTSWYGYSSDDKWYNENSYIYLKWNNISGANQYQIYRKASNGEKFELLASTKSTSYKDRTALINRAYYYSIKACKTKNKKVTASSKFSVGKSAAIVSINVPEITLSLTGTRSIEISTGYSSDSSQKYLLQMAKVGQKFENKGYFLGQKITLNNLEQSTTYYFRVAAAKDIDGKTYCTDYSKPKSIRTDAVETDSDLSEATIGSIVNFGQYFSKKHDPYNTWYSTEASKISSHEKYPIKWMVLDKRDGKLLLMSIAPVDKGYYDIVNITLHIFSKITSSDENPHSHVA